MPCPNEVNPPTWLRFAAWQVKWKGKSNHVRTCAQWADYGGIMRIGAHNTQASLFVCNYFRLFIPTKQRTTKLCKWWRMNTKCVFGSCLTPMTVSRHKWWEIYYSMRIYIFKREIKCGSGLYCKLLWICMNKCVSAPVIRYHQSGLHE